MKAKSKTNVKQVKKMDRSTMGMRDVLFDEIDLLREGKTSPARANAMARAVSTISDTVWLEIELKKMAMIGVKTTSRKNINSEGLQLGRSQSDFK